MIEDAQRYQQNRPENQHVASRMGDVPVFRTRSPFRDHFSKGEKYRESEQHKGND